MAAPLEKSALAVELTPANLLPPLSQAFYARETLQVARELLGKILVVRGRGGVTAGKIVETEGYHGDDPACHAARGETPRCSVMFGEPGHAYVYFIYGMYEMLNFVTERKGYPGAVLIRALEPVFGVDLMKRRRHVRTPQALTSGPGRLCRAMGIRLSHKGKSLMGPELLVVDSGDRPKRILASPRVGIRVGRDRLWRYFIAESTFVSRAAENARAVEYPVEYPEEYYDGLS